MKISSRGFTLVQLLAVLALLAIGIAIGFWLFGQRHPPPPTQPPSKAIHGDFIPPLPKLVQTPVQIKFLLTIKTLDSTGTVTSTTPYSGQTIAFQLTTGNAAIDKNSAVTDGSGVATVTLSGVKKGTDQLSASFTDPATKLVGSEAFSFEVNVP
jgi:Tfp pilus assembly protein FimT